MKTNLYAIYDTACGVYTKMVFAQADGMVTREFQDLVNDAESAIGQHPEDYSIFRLGNFNDLTGLIVNEDNECLATGLEMVALSRNVKRDQLEKLDDKISKLGPDDGFANLSPGGTA